MQNNLRMKTLKPMINDVKPNKYELEAVKSRDPGHALFWRVKGHVTFFKFWDPSITFERMKL